MAINQSICDLIELLTYFRGRDEGWLLMTGGLHPQRETEETKQQTHGPDTPSSAAVLCSPVVEGLQISSIFTKSYCFKGSVSLTAWRENAVKTQGCLNLTITPESSWSSYSWDLSIGRESQKCWKTIPSALHNHLGSKGARFRDRIFVREVLKKKW